MESFLIMRFRALVFSAKRKRVVDQSVTLRAQIIHLLIINGYAIAHLNIRILRPTVLFEFRLKVA